jgi:hypothetical protein
MVSTLSGPSPKVATSFWDKVDFNIGSSNQPPNLHVGGVKMRERNKGPNPLRVISQNRIKDSNHYDDEAGMRVNTKKKQTRKIIKAGSLARKNVPGPQKGRNNVPFHSEDFSNSFIEGKSFNTTNSKGKKGPSIEKPYRQDSAQMSNTDNEYNEIPRNVRDLEANSKILDFQNKNISSASIGPYPIGGTDPTVTMKSIAQANDTVDKKIKQKQYVQELEEQIKLRDQIRKDEEAKRRK